MNENNSIASTISFVLVDSDNLYLDKVYRSAGILINYNNWIFDFAPNQVPIRYDVILMTDL